VVILGAGTAGMGIAVARAAVADGLAEVELDDPVQQVHEAMWRPEHPRVEAV
jgi:malate dehydrogenase (oxaloacetate-decarboxylating)